MLALMMLPKKTLKIKLMSLNWVTKMRTVVREAIAIRSKNKIQVDKLKKKNTKDLCQKYVIQAPRKRKLKIKIYN